jgi:uncharacterized membrane protein YczE
LGLILFAAAIVAVLESRLGLAPWDVFHQGIATNTPLTFGQVGIAVGLVILCVAWALGQPPGWGTLANAVLVGLFIDAFSSLGWVDRLSLASLPARSGLLFAGIALFGVGSALYIGAGLGAGPRDSMMLVLASRSGFRIGIVRTAIEATVLVLGFVLGGTAGIGTAVVAVLVGPTVEASFWLVCRIGLAAPTGTPEAVV